MLFSSESISKLKSFSSSGLYLFDRLSGVDARKRSILSSLRFLASGSSEWEDCLLFCLIIALAISCILIESSLFLIIPTLKSGRFCSIIIGAMLFQGADSCLGWTLSR